MISYGARRKFVMRAAVELAPRGLLSDLQNIAIADTEYLDRIAVVNRAVVVHPNAARIEIEMHVLRERTGQPFAPLFE